MNRIRTTLAAAVTLGAVAFAAPAQAVDTGTDTTVDCSNVEAYYGQIIDQYREQNDYLSDTLATTRANFDQMAANFVQRNIEYGEAVAQNTRLRYKVNTLRAKVAALRATIRDLRSQ